MGKNVAKHIRWILAALAAFIAFAFGSRSLAKMGFADNKERGFTPVPGSKTKILTTDHNGMSVVIDTPKDPHTGRQYKSSDIKAVGISKTTKEIKVEILHDRVDRRNPDSRAD